MITKFKIYEYHDSIKNSFNYHALGYSCSLEDINKGHCDEITYDVIKDVVGEKNYRNILEEDNFINLSNNIVYEIDDGMFWSSEQISEYKTLGGDYWNMENMEKFGLPPFDYSFLSKFDLKGHVWIYYNGHHYDVETVKGVNNFWDLPIYKRQILKLK